MQPSLLNKAGTKAASRRGGRRPGSGRKPVGERRNGPEHRTRAALSGRAPVLVTLRFHQSIRRNLRARRYFDVIRRCLRQAKERRGCRICHFSVQRNHIHLLIEPPSAAGGVCVQAELGLAIRGLAISIARRINRSLARRGAAFAHRFHCRELSSPLAVKRALTYLIHNGRKHARQDGTHKPSGWIDPCSSAAYVPVWSRRSQMAPEHEQADDDAPVASPRTWLLRLGWHRKHRGLDAFAAIHW